MGFISRRILPACGSLCVCCPALSPSSRRPVKRYKKLLAEIFPKTLDGPPNEKKITKLCEYAARNPHRIPKIARFLEQKSDKELRTGNINFIKIIIEIYSKLLCSCKEHMAYFASSLLNLIVELLDHKKQETVQILGCQILTKFIHGQADNTYTHNIEALVKKVCVLARENGDEHKRQLRAASLQCLSAMVWFMTQYSYIFSDLDEIIYATLQNYGIEGRTEDVNQRREPHHNWVDEVVRSEPTAIIPPPEAKDSSKLTREECESPEVWSRICIQKLVELARERSTMRCVLDPIFVYFDNGRHWDGRHGLALRVLSDMSYFVKSCGNEKLILAAIIRHLDHKNVIHDPWLKSDVAQTAACVVRQLGSRAGVAEIAIVSDLCRHLRKSLEVNFESVGLQESNWNDTLQNSIEDCLVEIAKGIFDTQPFFDMMANILEKLPASATVARATIESLLILAQIISLTSVNSNPQLVFPESLLWQLTKAMVHPDSETRVGAHRIFSVILVRSATYPRHEYENRKWQSKSTSALASATALFEKLRREKESMDSDRLENYGNDDTSVVGAAEEEANNGKMRKTPKYYHKVSYSVIDMNVVSTSPADTEGNILALNEDQIAHLLSALWQQANQPDNLPSNFEAIAHSFSLILLSAHFKSSSHCNAVRFFQLPLSLMKVSLDTKGILHPSCQRSLLTLAFGMLAFAGKIYQMTDLTDALKSLMSNADLFLRVGDDLQICILPQMNLKDFGSEGDQQAANSRLADFRKMALESGQHLLDIIIQGLSKLTNMEKDALAQQLSEIFTPEDGLLFSSMSVGDWDTLHSLGKSDESVSLDEESSRTSSADGDGDIISESTSTDPPRSISKIPTKPPLSPLISVGQLLESALHVAGDVAGTTVSTSPLPYGTMASQCDALGMGMRKKLSTWLVDGQESVSDDEPLPTLPALDQSGIAKFVGYELEKQRSEQMQGLRLPPASPFDNFMRAARC